MILGVQEMNAYFYDSSKGVNLVMVYGVNKNCYDFF